MDISIVLTATSLIVVTLAQAYASIKEKNDPNARAIGISIIQLILTLDKIIDVGDKLVNAFSDIPLEGEISRIAILGKKWDIVELIESQQNNINEFIETSQTPLTAINSQVPVMVGDAVAIMVPDEVKVDDKFKVLHAITWKLQDEGVPFNRVSTATQLAMQSFENSVQVDSRSNILSLRFIRNARVKETEINTRAKTNDVQLDSTFTETYDLTNPSDLIRCFEGAKKQLSEIKDLRQSLAELTRKSFTVDDLLHRESFFINHAEINTQNIGAIHTEETTLSKIEVTLGDGNTFHGDFIVAKKIEESFNKVENSSVDEELKELLKKLTGAVGKMSEFLPSDDARKAARELESLTEETTSESPEKDWWVTHAERIKMIAGTSGDRGEPVIKLVSAISTFLST